MGNCARFSIGELQRTTRAIPVWAVRAPKSRPACTAAQRHRDPCGRTAHERLSVAVAPPLIDGRVVAQVDVAC